MGTVCEEVVHGIQHQYTCHDWIQPLLPNVWEESEDAGGPDVWDS